VCLDNKNVVLFITHLGLNSYIESAYSGVPMVALPLIIDQHFNAGAAVQKQLAVIIDKFEVTKETVKNAVLKVLGNPM
jgi:UDP:flavonoid glycosyltransferase YjiC (YdhE family)